jgi:hypothetical protein
MRRLFRYCLDTACAVVLVGSSGSAVAVQATPRMLPAAQTPQFTSAVPLSLSFEPNRGQAGAEGAFMARGQGFSILLSAGAVLLALAQPQPATGDGGESATALVRMTLVGANPHARAVGRRLLPGTVSYFIGDDPRAWRTGLPTYGQVRFTNVYPGIDLLYDGAAGHLAYEFVLAPGADAGAIRQRLGGTRRVSLDARGNLVLGTSVGDLLQQAPLVYQPQRGGGRTPVAAHYQLVDRNQVRFALAGYDRHKPLVIDPAVSRVAPSCSARSWKRNASTSSWSTLPPTIPIAIPLSGFGASSVLP